MSFHVRYVRAHIKYDRVTLLQLGELNYRGYFDINVLDSFPELHLHAGATPGQATTGGFPGTGRSTRKRGRRGGGGRRLRRLVSKGRLTLPIILFANVQSLVNKMDELFCRMATQRYFKDCSVLCFCETWLGQRTPDEAITPAGYTVYRADRSETECGKTRGGGTAILVKQSWSTDNMVISQSCSENVEYITVKCRPFYLPRELQCVILSTVYIHPAANEHNALKELHDMISRHENSYPDAAIVILGDFNHCDLRNAIPRFYQCVNFPTGGNRTLDKCYSNIRNAYTAVSKPHFGKCNHLAILLQPIYIRKLIADPDTVRTVNMWTDTTLEELQGCLEATDMNIFREASDNIHKYTDTVSSYIEWYTSICIPSRTIRVLPNQKPWFNADVRIKIKKRSIAFKSGDVMEYKHARYEVQKSIRAAKRAYTQRLENCYRENNSRSMWQGIGVYGHF